MPFDYTPPIITNPTGLDGAIAEIQSAMSGITYVEQSWARAFHIKEQRNESVLVIPKAYYSSSEYVNLLPNPDVQAMTFVVVRSPERNEDYDVTILGQRWERDLSLIFWGDLSRIDPTKDYIFTEEIRADLEKALSECMCVLEIGEVYDEEYSDIFEGFSLPNETETQWLMYPFAGIRIDLTVIYTKPCRTYEGSFLAITEESNLLIDNNSRLII